MNFKKIRTIPEIIPDRDRRSFHETIGRDFNRYSTSPDMEITSEIGTEIQQNNSIESILNDFNTSTIEEPIENELQEIGRIADIIATFENSIIDDEEARNLDRSTSTPDMEILQENPQENELNNSIQSILDNFNTSILPDRLENELQEIGRITDIIATFENSIIHQEEARHLDTWATTVEMEIISQNDRESESHDRIQSILNDFNISIIEENIENELQEIVRVPEIIAAFDSSVIDENTETELHTSATIAEIIDNFDTSVINENTETEVHIFASIAEIMDAFHSTGLLDNVANEMYESIRMESIIQEFNSSSMSSEMENLLIQSTMEAENSTFFNVQNNTSNNDGQNILHYSMNNYPLQVEESENPHSTFFLRNEEEIQRQVICLTFFKNTQYKRIIPILIERKQNSKNFIK
jgi:hypothetical protein